MNADALINHYSVVADNVPIPVMSYNVPKFTHINLTAEVISRLSEHPNIRGVKDSSGNIALLGEFLNRTGDTFDVLVGTAGVLFGALTLGCPGGILALANVAPENCVKIFEWVKDGLFDRARDLQLQMIPVNQAITATYGIAGLKAAMDMVGYFGGEPRFPLFPVSEKEKSELRDILSRARLC